MCNLSGSCSTAVDHNIESDNLNSTYLFCTNCSFATESYCILIHSLLSSALRLPLHPSLSVSLSLILSFSLEGSAQCSSQPWLNYLLGASAAEPRRLRSSRFPQQPSRPDRWLCKEHGCYPWPDYGTNGLCRHCGVCGTLHGLRILGPPAVPLAKSIPVSCCCCSYGPKC